MTIPAIRVQGLAKEFAIGGRQVRGESFREMLVGALTAPLRRLLGRMRPEERQEPFWALRGVTFEVQPGEVVGVIGRNGAGKSTLLKILSRITEPSEGEVTIAGRVSSLLEVGTGFHGELTGRENIFLNGSILGMPRREIEKRFEQIVDFSEIGQFLDTPVKRYSSGMYMRLAFAVAAHMEPEVLLVDEVLAVGDLEFQKKCLGKMSQAASGGRAVLFVSHNMAAIKSLTTRCLLLQRGRLVFDGPTDAAVEQYVQSVQGARGTEELPSFGRGERTAIRRLRLLDAQGETSHLYVPGQPLRVELELETDGSRGLSAELFLCDYSGTRLCFASLHQFHGHNLPLESGIYRYRLVFAPLALAAGHYSFDVATSVVNIEWDHEVEGAATFEVISSNPGGQSWNFLQSYGYGHQAMLLAEPAHAERLGA